MDSGLESGRRMKSPILLTVPRTGTGFFSRLLLQPCGTSLTTSHVSPASITLLDRISNPFIITTWRDWGKVKDSFLHHGDSLELFDMHFVAWLKLISIFDPLILTVEPEYNGVSREARLTILGELLGTNLETDWEPVNEWKEVR